MLQEERIYSCAPETVIVDPDRIRKIFNKKKMDDLVASIMDKGQLQAGVCKLSDGKPVLIAGERRLRACEIAKIPYRYTLEDETDPLRIKEIEYEENIHREDLDFREQAKAIELFHKLEQQLHGETSAGAPGGHSVRDTATMLSRSVGNVAEEIELAKFLEVDEVAKSKNKTEAKKVIKRLKEEYVRGEQLKQARTQAVEAGDVPPTVAEEGATDMETQVAEQVAFFDPKIINGRMEDVLEGVTEEYDVVLFDPPWGVDYDSVRNGVGSQREFEDSEKAFRSSLSNWLQIIFDGMVQDSHFYMFFGIVHYDLIYDALESVGFQTNRIPIIWYKQGMHRTRAPDLWPGRSYEPIAFARKGDKALVRKGAADVIITPFPTPTIKQSHPAAKHPDVYIDLLKRSALPGDKVLDPMAGSGMAGVACETLRSTHHLDWKLIELDESFADLALANVIRGYHQLVRGPVGGAVKEPEFPFYLCLECCTFGESSKLGVHKKSKQQCICPTCSTAVNLRSTRIPEDYRDINLKTPIGQAEWKAYWKSNPEKQEEMLEWKSS